jgi:hypothetical protein
MESLLISLRTDNALVTTTVLLETVAIFRLQPYRFISPEGPLQIVTEFVFLSQRLDINITDAVVFIVVSRENVYPVRWPYMAFLFSVAILFLFC